MNLAVVQPVTWKPDVGRTGINKRPASGPVSTGEHQLVGDTICDLRNHGGPDQAAYAYSVEDAAWWAEDLSRDVCPGQFGENFTTSGFDLNACVVGERWAIGSAVFEVSRPRIPCRTLAGFWDVPDMIKLFTAAARPGAYLRIVMAGVVQAGDRIELVHRPPHDVTIGETFRALTGDHSLARRLLQAPELPVSVHQRARAWLADASTRAERA